MNEQQTPHPMSPEDQALAQEAGQAEQAALTEAMVGYLQNRNVLLAMEVRRRDARIAELETDLARHTGTADTSQVPGSGD